MLKIALQVNRILTKWKIIAVAVTVLIVASGAFVIYEFM
jgi:hypothetical protein